MSFYKQTWLIVMAAIILFFPPLAEAKRKKNFVMLRRGQVFRTHSAGDLNGGIHPCQFVVLTHVRGLLEFVIKDAHKQGRCSATGRVVTLTAPHWHSLVYRNDDYTVELVYPGNTLYIGDTKYYKTLRSR